MVDGQSFPHPLADGRLLGLASTARTITAATTAVSATPASATHIVLPPSHLSISLREQRDLEHRVD